MKRFVIGGVIILVVLLLGGFYFWTRKEVPRIVPSVITKKLTPLFPLSIEAMRSRAYPGSAITIEQQLDPGSNYHRYIASYTSDGLKNYGLLTVPIADKPKDGWPVIIFNHGYIPPNEYKTTERYVAYVDAFAHNGYIVFKPDYRGNGNSEGIPEGAYFSPAYTVDDLNAIASMKKYKDANPNRLGVWGHSMGGNITLRDVVVNTKDIKAAVIWGGVVGSYDDLSHWHDPKYHPSTYETSLRRTARTMLEKLYGTPKSNPAFWQSIDPTHFVSDITTPIALHHGEADEEVPLSFSQNLYTKLQQARKSVELFTYPSADHNISDPSFSIAIKRSVAFFDKYLK